MTISIYSVTGDLGRTLDIGCVKTGIHQAYWDVRDDKGQPSASGVYFYVLKAGEFSSNVRKMLLVR